MLRFIQQIFTGDLPLAGHMLGPKDARLEMVPYRSFWPREGDGRQALAQVLRRRVLGRFPNTLSLKVKGRVRWREGGQQRCQVEWGVQRSGEERR